MDSSKHVMLTEKGLREAEAAFRRLYDTEDKAVPQGVYPNI